MLTVAVAMALATNALAAPADAETFGQIGAAWGTPGTGPGQFFDPGMLGVDPSDGSVYAGDITLDLRDYRIQKLSSTGTFGASVEISRFSDPPEDKKIVTLHGIAVDPALHRFYLIEGGKAHGEFGEPVARRILVFSTEPEEGKLVPPAEGPASLPLPEGEKTLYKPQTIVVDPSNHDLAILAENDKKHTVVQRISSTGGEGARFVDVENVLRPSGGEATSIAVGPTGQTYALTGGLGKVGAQFTRAWDLPPELSGIAKVPGFAEAAEREGWITGLLSPKSSPLFGGPQLAISPDGSVLYWKESLSQSEPDEPSRVLVRGYSLAENKTNVLYGGGEASCSITTPGAGIATTAGRLIVFDYGPEVGQGKEPSYGDKVLTFGPGGSGCPRPAAKFSVNGKEEEGVTVEKGEVVTLDASNSELLEGFRRELIWKFGDGSEKTVEFTPGTGTEPAEEAEPTVTHQYTTAGDFTVRLEIKLSEAPFGSPPPVEHTLKVEGPSKPKFKLTVSEAGSGTVTSSPNGIACGATCEAKFEEGTVVTLIPNAAAGSEFKGWGGACTGIGTCEVTMSAAKSVSAEFAPALKPQFKLTVSEVGSGTVTSSPGGVSCGDVCEAEYEEGTNVMLTATPAAGSEFKGWGGACTGIGTCEVTMSAAKSVSAEFALAPKHKLKLIVVKSGPGIVTSSPSGVACGAICERGYEKGEVVTLIPNAAAGSEFKGWGGACTGIGTCEVTMSAAKSVSATFASVLSIPPIESPPLSGGDKSSSGEGGPPPAETKPKQKARAKCKKLKGKAHAKCVKRHHRRDRR